MRFEKSPFGVIPVLTPPSPPSRLQTQIVFESRLGAHDVGKDCTMTVDGTDFRIPQKGIVRKGERLHVPQVRGEVRPALRTGVPHPHGEPEVWIQGLYPAGKYTDIKISNNVLCYFLKPGKRIKADQGYHSHPDKIKCPGNNANLAENQAK